MFLPVRIVMVHIIVVVIRIRLQKLETVIGRTRRSNQFGSVDTILLPIHHIHRLGQ